MVIKDDTNSYVCTIKDPLANLILRLPTFTIYRATNQKGDAHLLLVANDANPSRTIDEIRQNSYTLCDRFGWSRVHPELYEKHFDSDNLMASDRCGISFPTVAWQFTMNGQQGNRPALLCAVNADFEYLLPMMSLVGECFISPATAAHLLYDCLIILRMLAEVSHGKPAELDPNLLFVDTKTCHLCYLGCGYHPYGDDGETTEPEKITHRNIELAAQLFETWSNLGGDDAPERGMNAELKQFITWSLPEPQFRDYDDLDGAAEELKSLIDRWCRWRFDDRRFSYRWPGQEFYDTIPMMSLKTYYGKH